MVKKILLDKKQFKRFITNSLNEAFLNTQKNFKSDVKTTSRRDDIESVDIDFDNDSVSSANHSLSIPNRTKDGLMRPTVVKLPRTGIECYNLFDFKTMEINQAIKSNTWGKNGPKVNWLRDSKKKFVQYCTDYISRLADYFCQRESEKTDTDLTIRYICWPQSSEKEMPDLDGNMVKSNFNRIFSTELKNTLSTYGYDNIEIVDALLLKSRANISVNEEKAKKYGCDAEDIAILKEWALSFEYTEDIKKLRRDIDYALNERNAKGRLTNNGVDTEKYQWKSNTDNDFQNKDKTKFKNFDTYTFFKNHKKGEEWTDVNKKSDINDELEIKNNKEKEDFEIPEEIINVLNKVKKNIQNIKDKYGEFDKKASDIQSELNQRRQNGDIPIRNNQGFSISNLNMKTTSLGKKTGKYKWEDEKDWEIKQQGEYARHILENLFVINQEKAEQMFDKENFVIVFDDNMAGGSTMDSTCDVMNRSGFKRILPFTINTIPLSDGSEVGVAQTLQKIRDARARELDPNFTSLSQEILNNRVVRTYGRTDSEGYYTFNDDGQPLYPTQKERQKKVRSRKDRAEQADNFVFNQNSNLSKNLQKELYKLEHPKKGEIEPKIFDVELFNLRDNKSSKTCIGYFSYPLTVGALQCQLYLSFDNKGNVKTCKYRQLSSNRKKFKTEYNKCEFPGYYKLINNGNIIGLLKICKGEKNVIQESKAKKIILSENQFKQIVNIMRWKKKI